MSSTLKMVRGNGEAQPAATGALAVRIVAVDAPNTGAAVADKSQLAEFGSRDWVAYRSFDSKHPVYAVGGTHYFAEPTDVWASSGVALEVLSNAKERFGSGLSGGGASSQGATINGSDEVVSVADTATLLLAANPNRRSVTVQNLSTIPVVVSKQAAVTAAPTKACAVLAGGAFVGDGSGGSVTIEGWSGPVYGIVGAGLTGTVLASDF